MASGEVTGRIQGKEYSFGICRQPHILVPTDPDSKIRLERFSVTNCFDSNSNSKMRDDESHWSRRL